MEESLSDVGEFGFTADEVDGGERAFGVEGEGASGEGLIELVFDAGLAGDEFLLALDELVLALDEFGLAREDLIEDSKEFGVAAVVGVFVQEELVEDGPEVRGRGLVGGQVEEELRVKRGGVGVNGTEEVDRDERVPSAGVIPGIVAEDAPALTEVFGEELGNGVAVEGGGDFSFEVFEHELLEGAGARGRVDLFVEEGGDIGGERGGDFVGQVASALLDEGENSVERGLVALG